MEAGGVNDLVTFNFAPLAFNMRLRQAFFIKRCENSRDYAQMCTFERVKNS